MAREAGPRTSCAMPLLDHQMALGQCLRGTDAEARTASILDAKEQGQIDRIVESAGFRFTRRVQRSWCRGRVASVARLTLSALPPEQAQKLLGDWIEMGGGTASHTAAEAGAFLEFIARDLPDPSHARTICRMEQAISSERSGNRFRVPGPPASSTIPPPRCAPVRERPGSIFSPSRNSSSPRSKKESACLLCPRRILLCCSHPASQDFFAPPAPTRSRCGRSLAPQQRYASSTVSMAET